MKFDKLVKMIGTSGVVIENNFKKYLCSGNMLAVIPETSGSIVCVASVGLPEYVREALANCEEFPAELTDAFLPSADDKTCELRRVFSTQTGFRVDISNRHFGLIEKYDKTGILLHETSDEVIPAALAIHNGYDEDISAYIFSRDFIQRFKDVK